MNTPAIVSYFINGQSQCNTGDVVKAGSKFVHVRERNTQPRPVVKLNIKGNRVKWLLGDSNPYGNGGRSFRKHMAAAKDGNLV